ncbi:unnamed protein product [Mucor hiemalis]
MLKISQQTISSTAKRQLTTAIVQRNVTRGSNVKKSLSLLTATTIKRQQPWKLTNFYMESKRFYAAGPGQGNQGLRMNPNQEQEQKSPLEQFGIDLTAMAETGKLDPVIGRDEEIRRTLEV